MKGLIFSGSQAWLGNPIPVAKLSLAAQAVPKEIKVVKMEKRLLLTIQRNDIFPLVPKLWLGNSFVLQSSALFSLVI
jgi:hypothetical protein